ncbi:MAG TPA: helix-turn-helix domain-containing protein [Syntrophales bacterium]|nr:helix-turn-helix domain-containing protein [Syntrophales bacterium]
MKPVREQNYYELLELSPDASPLEISRAYKKAFELYHDGSMASYSFFSAEERKEIVCCLEEAYLTLINPESRTEYDKKLIELGVLEKGQQYRDKVKEPISIYEFRKDHPVIRPQNNRMEDLRSRALQNPLIQEILARDILSGEDLKKIRTALGITLEKIAELTNIRVGILQAIEEDKFDLFLPMVYLKGFLKSYARCLQVDESIVINGYIKRFGIES